MQKKERQLPTCVRQIGEAIGEDRVYIEDYAYGHLCELNGREDEMPVRAALYGHAFQNENGCFRLIYGVASVDEEGQDAVSEQIRSRFFADYELLGYAKLKRTDKVLGEKCGFFIFYEDNEAMQNYLLACRGVPNNPRKQQKSFKAAHGVLKLCLVILTLLAATAVAIINSYDRMSEFVMLAVKAAQEIR